MIKHIHLIYINNNFELLSGKSFSLTLLSLKKTYIHKYCRPTSYNTLKHSNTDKYVFLLLRYNNKFSRLYPLNPLSINLSSHLQQKKCSFTIDYVQIYIYI